MRCHRILAVVLTLAVSLTCADAFGQARGGTTGGTTGGGGGATGGAGGVGAGGGDVGTVSASAIGSDITFDTDILGTGGEFVGSSASAAQEAAGATNAASVNNNMQNGQQAQGGQQNRANQRQQARTQLNQGRGQTGNTQQVWLRPNFKVPVTYRLAAAPPVTDLNRLVQRAMTRASLAGLQVQVTMEGSTAILQGEVGSERDRVMIAKLVGFEPGVGSIQNELQVEETLQPPAPSPSDTSNSSPSLLEETGQLEEPMLLQ